MNNIDEMIADAKAEEEIALEMKKTKKPSFQPVAKNTATIDLEDYVMLRQIEASHRRLVNLILENSDLAYNEKSLSLRGNDVLEFVRMVYPASYEQRLKELQENKEDE